MSNDEMATAFREFAQRILTEIQQAQTIKPATMDIKQAAIYLGVHFDTVKKLIREKELPHVRIAGRILLRPSTLDQYMAEQERQSILIEKGA